MGVYGPKEKGGIRAKIKSRRLTILSISFSVLWFCFAFGHYGGVSENPAVISAALALTGLACFLAAIV